MGEPATLDDLVVIFPKKRTIDERPAASSMLKSSCQERKTRYCILRENLNGRSNSKSIEEVSKKSLGMRVC